MKGQLNTNISLNGILSTSNSLNGSIRYYDEYQDTYTITPSTEAQTIETKNKLLADNLTINPIPYVEEQNDYGMTIYIG